MLTILDPFFTFFLKGKLGPIFKLSCIINFLFWHYFVPEQKSCRSVETRISFMSYISFGWLDQSKQNNEGEGHQKKI
jgi:hypothetical protein